ncbi:hypothetical protein [Streptomyces sp. NPDC002845]
MPWDNSLNNHLNTWKIAYNIEGIREWIFRQHKQTDQVAAGDSPDRRAQS